jgi:hypothetical protein
MFLVFLNRPLSRAKFELVREEEIDQMVGRCSRMLVGLALLRSTSPPGPAAFIAAIAPARAEQDVLIWAVLRLLKGTRSTVPRGTHASICGAMVRAVLGPRGD